MKDLFKKFKIRSLRIVLERVNLEEYDIKQLPLTTQKDSKSKIQLKECKVVLSRSETEEIIRKLQNVHREEHRSLAPKQRSPKKTKNARKMVLWLPQSTEYKIPHLTSSEKDPAAP